MICVTGDLHGDLTRFKAPQLKKLRRGDALIICGDFGCIWDGSKKERKTLKKLGKKKYNILFVEGTHENYDLLEEYPVEQWCGGKTRLISGNLRQLMRGQFYEIAGKRIFSFGGGQSDENTSYLEPEDEKSWVQELPTNEELREGVQNLLDNGKKADYIITYEPPAKLDEFIDIGKTNRNHINTYLDKILEHVDFKMWYFGKRHINKLIPPRYQCLFDAVEFADKTRLKKQKAKKSKKDKKEKD
ncbi:MAG: metallophosphoesterase [Eubacterium sp.]|nr:metallophosphoesterase [Eubacterium sp.]